MAAEKEKKTTEADKFEIEDIVDPLDETDGEVESKKELESEKTEQVEIEEAASGEPTVEEESETIAEDAPQKESDLEEHDAQESDDAEMTPEPSKKEKTKKAKKPKKPFPVKTVAIVVITFLVTLALVLGGFYLYQKYRAPKEEATEETTSDNNIAPEVNNDQDTGSKSIYINAETGLNLRKEPSATSEKLATVPYGTKLTVLETQDTWYKTTYNNLTGWIDSTYTQESNPLIYTNTKYGFQLTLPVSWGAYKVKEGGATEVALFYIELPTTDKNWNDSTADSGYASLIAVTVYTKSQYEAAKAEGGAIGTPIATKGDYVFLANSSQAVPSDLTARFEEISAVVKTFQAT